MAFFVVLAGALLLLPVVLWRGVIWQAEGWAIATALGLEPPTRWRWGPVQGI